MRAASVPRIVSVRASESVEDWRELGMPVIDNGVKGAST